MPRAHGRHEVQGGLGKQDDRAHRQPEHPFPSSRRTPRFSPRRATPTRSSTGSSARRPDRRRPLPGPPRPAGDTWSPRADGRRRGDHCGRPTAPACHPYGRAILSHVRIIDEAIALLKNAYKNAIHAPCERAQAPKGGLLHHVGGGHLSRQLQPARDGRRRSRLDRPKRVPRARARLLLRVHRPRAAGRARADGDVPPVSARVDSIVGRGGSVCVTCIVCPYKTQNSDSGLDRREYICFI